MQIVFEKFLLRAEPPLMKAFLLTAGRGTRLRPLTEKLPKCLLPIRGIPILQIWLELCCRFGIDEVLINIHSHADAVRQFVQRKGNTVKIHLFEETTLLGSAGTLLANRDWVARESAFWVLYGDVLTTVNLNHMMDFHRSHGQLATLGVYEVPDPSRCGVVEADKRGIIRSFVEKPVAPSSHLAFAGLLVGTWPLLDAIPRQVPADIGFHVLPQLVGRMAAYRISDYLIDIGTTENYEVAQRDWPGFQSPHEDGAQCSGA